MRETKMWTRPKVEFVSQWAISHICLWPKSLMAQLPFHSVGGTLCYKKMETNVKRQNLLQKEIKKKGQVFVMEIKLHVFGYIRRTSPTQKIILKIQESKRIKRQKNKREETS